MAPKPFAGLDPDSLPGFIPSVPDAMQVTAAMFSAVEAQYSSHKCESVIRDGVAKSAVLSGVVAMKSDIEIPGDSLGSLHMESHLFVGHAALGATFTTRLMGDVREGLLDYFNASLPAGSLRDVGETTFRVVLPDGEFTVMSRTASGRSYISTMGKVRKRRFAFN